MSSRDHQRSIYDGRRRTRDGTRRRNIPLSQVNERDLDRR